MDLLHEELKEPVPPAEIRQDVSPRKPANKTPTRSKRLLGGQTMVDRENEELKQSN